MSTFDLELPDGRVIQGIPEGTTKAQIAAKLGLPADTASPNPVTETAKVVGKSLYGGLTSLPRFVKEAGDWLEERMPTPGWSKIPIPGAKAIEQVDTAIRQAVEPKSRTGRVLGNIGEAAVGAIAGPGGLASLRRSALIGAGGGAGGELMAALTDDSALARGLGAIAGGGATALGLARVPTANSMVKTAVKGVTPEDWKAAAQAEAVLQRAGLPYLSSQLLGPASSLDDVVAQASSHPQVRPQLLNATRDLSPKVQQTMEIWKQGNLPVATEERRGLLLDVQKAAKDADTALVRKSNAEYVASMPPAGGVYSPGYLENLKKDIKELANSTRYGPTTAGGKALTRFSDEHLTLPPGESMPVEHLNNLVKDLNTIAQQEGWKGLPAGDLKALLKSYTPEFEAARAAKQAVMQAEVTPLRQGLAGDIARMGGGPDPSKYTVTGDVLRTVFPLDKSQRQAILKLGQDVGDEPVGHLLREHLTRSMETALKGLHENPTSPAKFVEAVAGTPAQRTNIDAALEVVGKGIGNPAAIKKGFYELLHAFGTYKDLKLAHGVAGANLQFEAGKSLPSMLVAPQSRLGRYLWEQSTVKTYQKIADLVTSPEGLKALERVARTPDPKVKGALLRGIIAESGSEDANPPGVTAE